MGKSATLRLLAAGIALSAALPAQAQPPVIAGPTPEWRRVGNSAIELDLADVATGPVERVWYAPEGTRLFARTGFGRTYVTSDFDTWELLPADTYPPPPAGGFAPVLPEPDAALRNPFGQTPRVYAIGNYVHRSDDGGRHWQNMTGYRGASIIGPGLRDLAISPLREDEITVATGAGVFRSMDGGTTWAGLNALLPNLPAARLRGTPGDGHGARIELAGAIALEWLPGERIAWRLADRTEAITEISLKRALSESRGVPVTAYANEGNYIYTGMEDGRISVAINGTWTETRTGGSAVTAFWIDPGDPRVALAALLGPSGQRVLHTINGGISWDAVTTNLPETPVHGIAADTASNAVYMATDAGVFMSRLSMLTLGAPPVWSRLGGLPAAPASDVQLSPGGVQLWAAIEEYGVYATPAPHRMDDPRVVSTADMLARAAAPGTLLSVVGAASRGAYAGGSPVPVLGTTPTETQIQVPFEAGGGSIALSVDGAQGRQSLPPVPLQPTAPAIMTGLDGAPMLLDAESGFQIDMMHPAHSRMLVQILATGLGRVRPDWPTGRPGPFDNVPQVVAPVQAYLDGEPVSVTRAVLAPGFVGYYLVEIEVPGAINYGPAELYIEAGGQPSNRVRVYIEP